MPSPAVVLAPGRFRTHNAKTAHGLVRGSARFDVVAVVDAASAGQDAGMLLDGTPRGIPVVATLREALERAARKPEWCIVGIATHGGKLTDDLRAELREAAGLGLSLVNGLHEFASDDPSIAAAAK